MEQNYKDILGYTPSEYQIKILDFIVSGHGNAVVKAGPGSGKTHIMVSGIKLIPHEKKCLFLAFNKAIRDEISNKLSNYSNCTVKTVHGLGYDILSSVLDTKPDVNEYKYRDYLRRNMCELCNASFKNGESEYNSYFDTIIQLLEFSRLSLAQVPREIQRVAKEYNITIHYDEDVVVKKLMDWGKTITNVIDYTDMVWLPNELDIINKVHRYDWIFNDEAQDYSVAYVKLFLKCFKRSTRFVACGDEYQSINQFAGASEHALEEMINYRNTQVLKLPISYRCDRAIISEANKYVSDIEARPDAGLGLIKQGSSIADIKINDMVLCRNNAPLFKMYGKLIQRGIPCYIKGKETDKEKLLDIIEKFSVGEDLGKDFKTDGLFTRLYDDMVTERNRLVYSGLENVEAINSMSVQSKYDTIISLITISSDCETKSQLIEKIEKIYNNDNVGVCLSTIHKAKGLEADNVHIICKSMLMPKRAKTDKEIQQERNLLYVAVTRSKHMLCFLSEKEFPPTRAYESDGDEITEFNYIETMVCKLYNKPLLQPLQSVEMAKFRLNNATNIESTHKEDNKTVICGKHKPAKERKNKLLDKLMQ